MTTRRDRIEAAAAPTGKTITNTLADLEGVVPTVEEVEVATNGDVTAIAVSVSLVADPHLGVRMHNLAAGISGSEALAISAAKRGGKLMRAERGSGPQGFPTGRGLASVFASVHHLEPRDLADDVALARDIGLPARVAEQLFAEAHRLGMRATTPRVTVHPGTKPADVQIELGAPAARGIWERLENGGGEPGRLLRALQPRAATMVWLGARSTGLLPWRRIELLQPDLEEAIAIAGKFGDVNRVQSFVAALGARAMASLSLTLGESPLGAAWLSASAA